MAITDSSDFPLFVLIASFFLVFLIVALVLYVYMSLAYTAVGKKAKVKSPALAWIPIIGPNLIAFKTAKMHWWPWVLLAGYFLPAIGVLAGLVFMVFSTIWHWKMFEKIGRPGFWAILMLIPIVNLVMIGIAAWGKSK